MTALLAGRARALTVVEGSEHFCSELRKRFPGVSVERALFEEYAPTQRFDTIVLGHVLEHVADPVDVLKRAAGWLGSGGRIFAAVPNSHSIHRQAAVMMGLLEREDSLNELDVLHGHRRVFNRESFAEVFGRAGLAIQEAGGYWLKPLANRQIEATWTPEMIGAFMKLGESYPDIAGELYIVACS